MEPSTAAFDTLLPKQILLLRAFFEHRVCYIIVGGYAVRHYGYLRNTHDLDILVEQTELNIERVIKALTQLDTTQLDKLPLVLLQPEKKIKWEDVEIFSTMKGMQFSELASQLQFCEFQGVSLPLISLAHIILSKQLALKAPERSLRWHVDSMDLRYLLSIARRLG